MQNPEDLLKEQQDRFSLPEFNTKIKFTPVMEGALLALLLLFALKGSKKLTGIVPTLCRLLNFSPNAVGAALKKLHQLQLLAYYREGTGRVVELNLQHDFLVSLLIRFFGADTKEKVNEALVPSKVPFGFIPTSNDYSQAIAFFQEQKELLETKITDYQEWLEWFGELEQLEKLAQVHKNEEKTSADSNDPFVLLSRKIVSAIDRKQSLQLQRLTPKEIVAIISNELTQCQLFPPWATSTFLKQQSSPFIIDHEEEEDEIYQK